MINLFLMLLLILIAISITSGFFGPFILWNRVSNYFDNFTHSAIFSVVISNFLHLNEFATLFVFASLFSVSISICLFFRLQLNNNLLIIISSLFIGAAGIINHKSMDEAKTHNAEIRHEHKNHDHDDHDEHENGVIQMFLGGDIEDIDYQTLLPYFYVSVILLAISIFFARRWIMNVVNCELVHQNFLYYFSSFLFLFILGGFAIVAVKINGIMLSISSTIFPALIAKNFVKTPYQMIFTSIVINMAVTIISFYSCKTFDIHYSGFVVIFEFCIFLSSIGLKKLQKKSINKECNACIC